jgi:hypothetical protein
MLTGVDALSTTAVTSTIGAVLLLVASLVVEGPAGLQAAVHSNGTAWGALRSCPGAPRPWPMPGISTASKPWVPAQPPATSPWCR